MNRTKLADMPVVPVAGTIAAAGGGVALQFDRVGLAAAMAVLALVLSAAVADMRRQILIALVLSVAAVAVLVAGIAS